MAVKSSNPLNLVEAICTGLVCLFVFIYVVVELFVRDMSFVMSFPLILVAAINLAGIILCIRAAIRAKRRERSVRL